MSSCGLGTVGNMGTERGRIRDQAHFGRRRDVRADWSIQVPIHAKLSLGLVRLEPLWRGLQKTGTNTTTSAATPGCTHYTLCLLSSTPAHQHPLSFSLTPLSRHSRLVQVVALVQGTWHLAGRALRALTAAAAHVMGVCK